MKTIQNRIMTILQHKTIWPFIALGVLMLFNLIFTPGFFDLEIKNGFLFGTIVDILNRAVPLIIVSIGMTLVIATEGIDISVGAIVAISGAIACNMIADGKSVLYALVIALLVSAICGLWNGFLVSKLGIIPMIGTLILMTVGRGIAQLVSEGQIIQIKSKVYSAIGSGTKPFALIILIIIITLVVLFLRKTSMGLFLESVGTNMESSRFAGIKSSNIIFIAYIICGLLAGVAGILISSNVNAADSNRAGLWMETDAILAVVIGGTAMTGGRAYVGGTIIGALFIQSLTTTIYTMGVAPEIIFVVKAVSIVIVCLIQSPIFRQRMKSLIKRRKVVGA